MQLFILHLFFLLQWWLISISNKSSKEMKPFYIIVWQQTKSLAHVKSYTNLHTNTCVCVLLF